jgi:hypothetical protein
VGDDRCVTSVAFLDSGDVVAADDAGKIGLYSVNNQGSILQNAISEFHFFLQICNYFTKKI